MNSKVRLFIVASLIPVSALVCGTLLVIYDHTNAAIFPFFLALITLPRYS